MSDLSEENLRKGVEIIRDPALRSAVLIAIGAALGVGGNAAVSTGLSVPAADVRTVCIGVAQSISEINSLLPIVKDPKTQQEFLSISQGTKAKPGTLLRAFTSGACEAADEH